MSWASISPSVLLPYSRERRDFVRALSEWHHTGEVKDLGASGGRCDLCGQPLRHAYGLANAHTGHRLRVGGECVVAFASRDEAEPGEDLRRRLDRARRRASRARSLQALIGALNTLAEADPEFRIDAFIGYLQRYGAFTPKQADTLLWRAEACGVSLPAGAVRIKLRRDKDKAQLLTLERWRVARLWPHLTASQQRWYRERRGRPPLRRTGGGGDAV